MDTSHHHHKPKLLHARLIILLFMLMVVASSLSVMTPLWGDYLVKLGGDLQSAGLAVSILSVGIAFFIICFSIITDRWPGYRVYIIISSLLLVACWVFYMCISTVTQLYWVLVLFSISRGMLWPAFDVLYTAILPRHKVATGWGLYATCEAAGGGAGALLGTQIIHLMGYKALFMVMMWICIGGLILSLFAPRIEKPPPHVPPHLMQ